MAGCGLVGRGLARQGKARIFIKNFWPSEARRGRAWRGGTGHGRAWRGGARRGEGILVTKFFMARQGEAWPGKARRGAVRQGKARIFDLLISG